jgi:ubiquinone/menaquinone biosynthesis C-methylase UbiE
MPDNGAAWYWRDDQCFNKALHHVQATALKPWFAAAQEKRDAEVPLDVLEVGAGAGRWASSFNPTKTRFVGIDVSEDLVRAARTSIPEGRFDLLSSDLLFPYEDESFDLAFSVSVMHHNPAPAKRTLLSEMWRVARPGGRLLFLETFVFTKQPEKLDIYPMSVTEFVDLIFDATAGQVVLEHVESLRYPDEDLRRGGLISLLRLGTQKT